MESGADFGFETVGSRSDKPEFIKRAKEKGYYVMLLFVTVSDQSICCERISGRVLKGGHGVPEDKVFARYKRTMSLLSTYLDLSDEAIVLDNSGSNAVEVIRKKDGVVKIVSSNPNNMWIKKYLE